MRFRSFSHSTKPVISDSRPQLMNVVVHDSSPSPAGTGPFQSIGLPPSGPSKQHNYVPRLRFIPATVVYGSKRLVPSGANPLHH
jgi:hypothetical protein